MTLIGRLRRWAEGYTSKGHFSPVGIVFHWVMAVLILFQLGLGWAMTLMMPVGGDKLRWFEIHSAIGLAIFILAILRLAFRVLVKDPFNDADTQGWRTTFAYVVEHLFYVCFIFLPLTGWAMWSAYAPAGPLLVGGLMPWPQLPFEELPLLWQFRVMGVSESLHLLLVWLLMILTPLHVAAALKHHFFDRSDVLEGMLPEVPDWNDPRAGVRHSPRDARPPEVSDAG